MYHDQKQERSSTGETRTRNQEDADRRAEGGAAGAPSESTGETLEVTSFREKDVRRFWSKVKILGPDECWLWQASCSGDGYGTTKFGPKVYGAHRLSYLITHGKPIQGWQILHRCDTPRCVNPNHLFIGTHQDNMDDRDNKGRTHKGKREDTSGAARGDNNGHATCPEKTPKGDWHPMAVLTDENVHYIREAYAKRLFSQTQLGVMFGVTQMNISAITTRRTWKHLP